MRASDAEWARWREAAEARGLSLNRWLRVTANAAADLEIAERAEIEEALAARARLRQLTFPQEEV